MSDGAPMYPDETQLHGEPVDAQAYGWLRFNGEELRKILSVRGITVEECGATVPCEFCGKRADFIISK